MSLPCALGSLPAPSKCPQVALYLDTYLSRDFMAYIVELCKDMGATLVNLAPPPRNLAVSRLEPHLGTLHRAGIDWEILSIEDGSDAGVPELLRRRPEVAALVCESRSSFAHRARTGDTGLLGKLSIPLWVLLSREPDIARTTGETGKTVDWLEPRLNRGF